MKRRLYIFIICLGLGAATIVNWRLAVATPGKSAKAAMADRKAFAAVQRTSITRGNYRILEFESRANFVREYISTTGVVFAVVWNGQHHTDLTSLVGSNIEGNQQASRRNECRDSGLKENSVRTDKWGEMGNAHGRVYAPALIPRGVSADEIV